jgi:hypothetical protein
MYVQNYVYFLMYDDGLQNLFFILKKNWETKSHEYTINHNYFIQRSHLCK